MSEAWVDHPEQPQCRASYRWRGIQVPCELVRGHTPGHWTPYRLGVLPPFWRRHLRREDREDDPTEGCPRPDKKRHATRESAERAGDLGHWMEARQPVPYLCICDWWHLGHLHRPRRPQPAETEGSKAWT